MKKYYKLIAIDSNKQQKLDVDTKITQRVNFTRNLDRTEGSTMFFITEEAKERVLGFWKGRVTVWRWFSFNLILT